MTISVDMNKARAIHRDRMRAARTPKLAALDVAFQRALETGAETSAIVAQKQALRDVTDDQAIDEAQTPDELKLVWPAILDPVRLVVPAGADPAVILAPE